MVPCQNVPIESNSAHELCFIWLCVHCLEVVLGFWCCHVHLRGSSRLCSHTLLHICSLIWVFLPTTDSSLSIYFSTMKPNIYSHELAQGECSECEVCALLERIRCFPWEMEVYFDLLHWAGKSGSEYCLYKSFTLAQQSSALWVLKNYWMKFYFFFIFYWKMFGFYHLD